MHRNPRDHSCYGLSQDEIEPVIKEPDSETELDSIIEEKTSIIEKLEDDTAVEFIPQDKSESVLERMPTILKKIDKNTFIILCIGILIGFSTASFIDSLSKDYKIEYEALRENYNIIQEKYGKVLNNITAVTDMYEILDNEKNSIEKELLSTKELLEQKTNDYNLLLSEYEKFNKEYSILKETLDNWEKLLNLEIDNTINPSVNEIANWLSQDETDKLSQNENLSDAHIGLILSLNGRTQNWKIGIIEIQGTNSTDEEFTIIVNSLRTELGMIYINSKTDEIWWYPNYIEINIGENWKLGSYENVSIKKMTTLLFN